MQKSFAMLAALLLLLQAGQAQLLKFGLKGGANLVKMEGKSFTEGFDLGYYAGAFVEMKLGEKWFVSPELLYSQTNLTTSTEFASIYQGLLNINNLQSIQLQALNIPVSINYRISNVLSLSAGPQFSLLLDRGESLMTNASNALKGGDLSLMTGATVTAGKFRIFGRYLWGIQDLNNINNADAWKAQTARLGVGFVL